MYFYIRDKKINMSNYLIILYIIRVAKKLASNRRLKLLSWSTPCASHLMLQRN